MELPTKRRKQHPQPRASEDTAASRAVASSDTGGAIAYWSQHHYWPSYYTRSAGDMVSLLARKRSIISRNRKSSETTTSSMPSSLRPKEEQGSEYKHTRYVTQLEIIANSYMDDSQQGISEQSRKHYQRLLDREPTVPKESLFQDSLFAQTFRMVRDRNEARIFRDITPLIVPSAETLAIQGATRLRDLVESVNEGWNNCIPISKTRPQPDYAVGFRRNAFSSTQLSRIEPIVGGLTDQSYFVATYNMYFPFLACEVKCGSAALDIADRQNAHSMTIAVRAVVELYRAVGRAHELNREILGFSISHDNETVRLYGHYAEIHQHDTKYYRHTIRKFNFTELDGKEKWTAYKFTKSIYEDWMPIHLERIRSAIDDIPPDISFSTTGSDLQFSEHSGLTQDVRAQSIAFSNPESQSGAKAGDTQSSDVGRSPDTPSTSVDGAAFKKPKRHRDP
ncbi:hypothetical protein CERZMDRAFT_31087 [Cercospora zeae-maydis SCOH1-5]|uniref:DUF7924 domain-containing protein n=1 Tax=Cercospora zeae-maydis SCOH1-5 TaxID=717836 RepID=A0A6A6FXK5_9PEZI|nr:hypothetical protein CERZMDRAFT_31087 [Cercospora zeae-maydis SCOH1-5]